MFVKLTTVVALLALSGAGCNSARKPTAAAPVEAPAAAPASAPSAGPRLQAGSSAYHLDLAAVYERYGEAKPAEEQAARALTVATGPAEVLPAQLALARLRQARGDRAGAVAALEQALAAQEKVQAAAPAAGLAPPLMPLMGGGADTLRPRLAQLYAETGKIDEAERMIAPALTAAREPFQRDQLLRAQVELYRTAGTLAARIKEREQALARKPADETALRFLAVAYGDGGPGPLPGAVPPPLAPPAAGAPASAPAGGGPAAAPVTDKVTRVYEQLLELHPEDGELRRSLVALYQQGQRTADAVALLRRAPPAAPGPGPGLPLPGGGPLAGCPGGIMPAMFDPRLQTGEEIVRLLMNGGQKADALAETAKLGVAHPGIGARLLAARLYAEQGRADLSAKALAAADKVARTPEERRAAAAARAEALLHAGRTAELKPLYERWQRGADPCLRAEGEQRLKMLAHPPLPGLVPGHVPVPPPAPAPPPGPGR